MQDGERSLGELGQIFLARKLTIFFVALAVTILVTSLAVTMPREYRAEVVIHQKIPSELSVRSNLGRQISNFLDQSSSSRYMDISSTELNNSQKVKPDFYLLKDNLSSTSLQQQYRENTNYLFGEINLSVDSINSGKMDQSLRLITTGHQPDDLIIFANQFTKFVVEHTQDEIDQRFQLEKESLEEELEKSISMMRDLATKQHNDYVRQLEQAILIAEKIDQIDLPTHLCEDTIYTGLPENIRPPLFLRGSRALTAELEILTSDGFKDANLTGLRPLEVALREVRSTEFSPTPIAKIIPATAASPSRRLNLPKVILVGFLLGGILGLFWAYIAHVLPSEQRRLQ